MFQVIDRECGLEVVALDGRSDIIANLSPRVGGPSRMIQFRATRAWTEEIESCIGGTDT